MIIRKPPDIPSSEITPESVYLNRRNFLAGLGLLAVGRGAFGAKLSGPVKSPFSTDEKTTPFQDVTHYNNFYEFGTSKDQPAELAKNFQTLPWTVEAQWELPGAVGAQWELPGACGAYRPGSRFRFPSQSRSAGPLVRTAI